MLSGKGKPPKPPSMDMLAAAAIILLEKIVKNTDELEGLLEQIVEQNDQTNALLTKILANMKPPPEEKVITSIKVIFKGVKPMPPVIPPPVVLTQVGQQVVAEIVAYDQFGNVWTGTQPDWSFENDNEEAATLDDQTGIVTAVANGVSNITGSVTTAEGVDLQDTESVTVQLQAEEPVITTIKVQFTSTGEGLKGAKKKPTVKR